MRRCSEIVSDNVQCVLLLFVMQHDTARIYVSLHVGNRCHGVETERENVPNEV